MPENVGVAFDTPVAIDLMEIAGTSNRRVSNMKKTSAQHEDGTV